MTIIGVFQVEREVFEDDVRPAESYRTRDAAEKAKRGWWNAPNRIVERDALLLDDGMIRLLEEPAALLG